MRGRQASARPASPGAGGASLPFQTHIWRRSPKRAGARRDPNPGSRPADGGVDAPAGWGGNTGKVRGEQSSSCTSEFSEPNKFISTDLAEGRKSLIVRVGEARRSLSVHVCVCASVQNKVSIIAFSQGPVLQPFRGQSTNPSHWGAFPTSVCHHYIKKLDPNEIQSFISIVHTHIYIKSLMPRKIQKHLKKQQGCFKRKHFNMFKVRKKCCIKITFKYSSTLTSVMSAPLNTPYCNIFLFFLKTS